MSKAEVEEILGIGGNDGGLEKMVAKTETELGINKRVKEERSRQAKIQDRERRLSARREQEIEKMRGVEQVWGGGVVRGVEETGKKVEKRAEEVKEKVETVRAEVKAEKKVVEKSVEKVVGKVEKKVEERRAESGVEEKSERKVKEKKNEGRTEKEVGEKKYEKVNEGKVEKIDGPKEKKYVKNVLYIVEDEKTAQFRYRVLNVQEAMEKSEEWSVEYVSKAEIAESWTALGRADLVVILRQTAKDEVILDLIGEARRRGIKVLFDLDDLVFDFKDLPVVMKATNSKNIIYWAGYIFGIRRIAKAVDGFLVTNEFLGEKIARSFGKPFKVIRNSLNKAQVEVGEAKKLKDFTLGYFSGSPTHVKDFRLVEPELVRFLRDYPDTKLRIVGYMELSAEMKKLKERGRVEVLGLVDYVELQKLMGEVDVNLAPLVVNDFTNCKSELKFFEAAAAGTVTVASPSFSFSRAIEDGRNGFLARTADWYGKIQFLYKHEERAQEMAEEARKDALENYFGEKFLKEVEEAYEYFGE